MRNNWLNNLIVLIIRNLQLWYMIFSIASMIASLIMKNIVETFFLASFHKFITCKIHLTFLLFSFFRFRINTLPVYWFWKNPITSSWSGPRLNFDKLDQIPSCFELICSNHFLLLHITFSPTQICTSMCSLKWKRFFKEPLLPTKTIKNIINWFISF